MTPDHLVFLVVYAAAFGSGLYVGRILWRRPPTDFRRYELPRPRRRIG